uniref:Small EDRK-rich factor-like N-terminal domain-containing protein n=1 Tax=Oryza nivara TaxID=4536 RepID=A0A0E0GMH7_ORYNI
MKTFVIHIGTWASWATTHTQPNRSVAHRRRGGVGRQRAQARKPAVKHRDDGLTLEQRRERDAKALQETAARKAVQGLTGSRQPEGAGQVEASACNKVRWWRKQRSVGRGFGQITILPAIKILNF